MTVAAVSLAAALVVSRPLPAEITHGLPVGALQLAELPILTRIASDTLQLYYQLWLVQDGLLGPTPLFTDPYQFRVNGPRWNLPQTFLPLSLPFTLLSPLGLMPPTICSSSSRFRRPASQPTGSRAISPGTSPRPSWSASASRSFRLASTRSSAAIRRDSRWPSSPRSCGASTWRSREGRLAGGVGGGTAFVALAMLEPQYTYLDRRAWPRRTR